VLELYNTLKTIAETEYKNIVVKTTFIHKRTIGSTKLRIFLKDGSFLDVWISETGKYSYHWEASAQKGLIYRHDNAPDFPKVSTHPKHLHAGDEKTIKPSDISDNPKIAIKEVLAQIKDQL
jgi:hypothetical protein